MNSKLKSAIKKEAEIKKLKREIIKKDRQIEDLETLVNQDFLTGIYNRRGFIRETEKFFSEILFNHHNVKFGKRRRLSIQNLSLVFIDLNDFKIINDRYGHKVGDKVIKILAELFLKSVRELDIVGRWGGDEFVIGLVDANEKEAYRVALKIWNRLGKVRVKDAGNRKLNASFGVIAAKSEKRKEISNIYELIERADMAMYQAKKVGKNSIVVL